MDGNRKDLFRRALWLGHPLAFLTAQSNSLTLLTDISARVVQITQGVAVLAVVVAYELVRRYRVRLEQGAVASAPRVEAEGVGA